MTLLMVALATTCWWATGNDSLTGGTGDDVIRGGLGNDTLSVETVTTFSPVAAAMTSFSGGNGSDVFVWSLADKGATRASGGYDSDIQQRIGWIRR